MRSITQSGDTATVTFDINGPDPAGPFNPPVDLFQLELTYLVSTDGDGNAILNSSFSLTSQDGTGSFTLLNYYDVSMEGFGGDTSVHTVLADGILNSMESQNGNVAFRFGQGADRFQSKSWSGGTGDLDNFFLDGNDMDNTDSGGFIDITAAFHWDFELAAGEMVTGGTTMQVGEFNASPEPASATLLGLVVLGLVARRRRKS